MAAAELPRLVQELAEFVGLGDADVATIRRTAPLVAAHETPLTEALYDHFQKFPFSARFFVDEDGLPDEARLERRKHSLGRWLRATAEAALTDEFAYYVLAIGLSHSHRAYGPGGSVPVHLVIGAMSLCQTALAKLFQRELDTPLAAAEASLAWNKLLLVQLAVLLQGYLPPSTR